MPENTSADSAPDPSTFTDVRIRVEGASDRNVALFRTIVFGAILLSASNALNAGLKSLDFDYIALPFTASAGVIGGCAALYALWRRGRRRIVTELATRPAEDVIGDYFRRVLRSYRMSLEPAPTFVARRLHAAGFVGRTFRVGEAAWLLPISPLETHFEPLPLNENDASFDTFRTATTAPMVRQRSFAYRRFARGFDRYGVPAILVAIALAVTIPLAGSNWNATKIITVVIVAGGAVALGATRHSWNKPLSACAFGSIGARWRLIPGGVAIFRALNSRHRVEVLDRRACVMLLYTPRPRQRRWSVIVATNDRHFEREVSAIECEMLLRAWLSPLPPPDEAMFSDWTDDA